MAYFRNVFCTVMFIHAIVMQSKGNERIVIYCIGIINNAKQKKYNYPLTIISRLELGYAIRQPIKVHVFLWDS